MDFIKQQRFFTTLVVVIGLVAGALLGTPGQNAFSETALVGFGTFLLAAYTTFGAINSRVTDGSMDAGDILSLIKIKEFWIGIFNFINSILMIFNVHVLESPELQATLSTAVSLLLSSLLNSWTDRAGGEVPVITQATKDIKKLGVK